MAYIHCVTGGSGGIPPQLQTDMDSVLNKKLGTSTTYPSTVWADKVNIMGLLPEKTVSGSVASFSDGADSVPIKAATFAIAPTLDGVTEVNVVRSGTNIWDEETEPGSIDTTTGKSVDYGTNRIRSKNYIPVVPNTNICVLNANNNVSIFLYCYAKDKTYNGIYSMNGIIGTLVITIPNDCYFLRLRTNDNYGSVEGKISLNYPSTETDYHAYSGTTRTIDLDTTCYGGSVTVDEDGECELTDGYERVDMGTLTYTYVSAYQYFYAEISDKKEGMTNLKAYGYTTTSAPFDGTQPDLTIKGGASNQRVFLTNRTYTDPSTLKTALSGVYLVFEKATPTESTLDPVTPIQTKLGVNNIWCDTGDTSVTYRQMGRTIWEGKKSTTAWSTPITFNEFDASDYEYIMLTFHAWKGSTEYQYVDLPIKVSDIKKNAEYQTTDDITMVVYEGSGSTLYSLYVRRDLNEVFYMYAGTGWATSIQMIKGA